MTTLNRPVFTIAAIVFCLVFLWIDGNGQWIKTKEQADSVFAELKKQPFEKISCKDIESVFHYYSKHQYVEEDSLVVFLKDIATRVNTDSVWGYYYRKKADAKSLKGAINRIPYSDSALVHALKGNWPQLQVELYSARVTMFLNLSNTEAALYNGLRALEISEKYDVLKYLPWRYFSVSLIYEMLKDTAREYEMAQKAYLAARRLNTDVAIGDASARLCDIENKLGNYNRALELQQIGFETCKTRNDSTCVANSFRQKAKIYIKMNKPELAISELNKALVNFGRFAETFVVYAYNEKASAFMLLNNVDSTISSLHSGLAIADQIHNIPLQIDVYKRLADAYAKKNDFNNAYLYLTKLYSHNELLITEAQRKASEELAVKYETEKKENEIKLLAQQKELKEKDASQKQLYIYAAVLVAALLLVVLVVSYRNFNLKRKTQAQLAEMQQQQRILQERTRIAAELHDDLGSGLTKISLMSQVAGNIAGDKREQTLHKITTESSDMVDRMNGIIWALNTKNDSLPNLISFIRKMAFEMFENSNIKIKWNAPEEITDVEVSGEVRRNIYLVVKEALHNALKYSNADEVKVTIGFENGNFKIEIADDGKGFIYPPLGGGMGGAGNGLSNMRKRMEEIRGEFEINSEIGMGTKICIGLHPIKLHRATPY